MLGPTAFRPTARSRTPAANASPSFRWSNCGYRLRAESGEGPRELRDRAGRRSAGPAAPVAFALLLPAQRWLRAAPVRCPENQNVGSPADDLGVAENMSLGFEKAPSQPARGIDLGSGR